MNRIPTLIMIVLLALISACAAPPNLPPTAAPPTAEADSPTAEAGPPTAEAGPPTAEADAPTVETDAPTAEADAPTAEADAEPEVTLVCNTGPSFDECGGPESVGGEATSANFIFMPSLYPEPVVVLIDVSPTIAGRPEVFVPELGQILGTLIQPLFPGPGQFLVNLPIGPTATTIDLDNNGTDDPGVQIYGLQVASNIIGDSYLQQLEQTSGLSSYIQDVTTGAITEGSFLLYAREADQGFPAAWGDDETWFTDDDPTITLPVGYTLATLAADGSVTLDRSSSVAMDTIERAEAASPDFADQGILESFNSLIDVLSERYAYTELRGLDWEAIRDQYLPAVTQADADEDFAAYYTILNELAISLQDTHVSATTNNIAARLAGFQAFSAQTAGNLGVSTVAVSDASGAISEEVQVVTVGDGTPADEAGLVPGTVIVSVDGVPTAERLEQVPLLSGIGTPEVRLAMQARLLLNFPVGQSVTVGYRLPESSEVLTETLEAGEYDTGAMAPPAGDSTPISYQQLGDYALVRWSSFINYVLPKIAVLEEALQAEQSRETGGVILDLRGNGGGWVTLYETMVSYFFTADDPMQAHVFDFYRYDAAAGEHVRDVPVNYQLSAPRPELAYTGPVVILVDQGCASACEYFSQHMQLLERATVIGQYTTSGAGGFIDRITLPGQITFQFTTGGTYLAGTDEPNLEGKGVVPDIRVPVTVETELARMRGEDPVLEAAIAFLDANRVDPLTSTTWRWSATSDSSGQITPVDATGDYTISFGADDSVAVTSDCNQANGTYTRNESLLSITLGPVTAAECGPDSQSEAFLTYLGAAFGFGLDGPNLFLLLQDSDVAGLVFEPAE